MGGLPAGKIEAGEAPAQAIAREVLEEAGVALLDTISISDTFYIRYADFHLFHSIVPNDVPVQISAEHQAFQWATPKQSLAMHLVKTP